MGLFGALTTAVTGMRAQAYALENVSGNIANSQTTAFKRIDTSFLDLIPDQRPSKQMAGSVTANARSTNNVQGDLQAQAVSTFMAINGDGFFIAAKASSFVDGRPVFDGVDRYTRRGDFQPDKNGYLINGAGYYLMGIPVDPTTGNLSGSVPQVLQFQNDFLPAQQTTRIDYRLNLARSPQPDARDPNVPGSELLNPAAFRANPMAGPPQAAKIIGQGGLVREVIGSVTGTGTFAVPGTTPVGAGNGGTLRITVAGTDYDIAVNDTDTLDDIVAAINGTAGLGPAGAVIASVDTSGGTNKLKLTAANADTDFSIGAASTDALTTRLGIAKTAYNSTNLLDQGMVGANETLTITIGSNVTTLTFGTGPGEISTLAELSAALGGVTGGTASIDPANGNITIAASSINDTITVDGSASSRAANFGLKVLTGLPSNQTVVGSDVETFRRQSISGGAITAYDVSGSPVNVQLRWAKVEGSEYGGTDTWNLFYQVDSGATGTEPAWQNVGINYRFGPNGQMNPPVSNVTLNNLTVDGVSLGSIELSHGAGGVTQFADANGGVKTNVLQQNGYPAGELQSVAVSDKGRISGTYSNGRTIDLAEVTLASFNGTNYLKRVDGGAYEVTDESGPPVLGASGKIVGSSLEGSNTDIADEFTKLIVTQQAYSANTRVITTSNQMTQDLLNMLR